MLTRGTDTVIAWDAMDAPDRSAASGCATAMNKAQHH